MLLQFDKECKVFFTSDTHFNGQRSFDLSMRSMYFSDLNDSTDQMIKRWNSKVTQNDCVIALGDFGDYEVAKLLNGNIILIYGDYERSKSNPPNDVQKKYFSEIVEDRLNTFMQGDLSLILTHEPENIKELDKEYFYLFGHIHEKQKVKRRGLNVGVDVHNFYPIDIDTIKFHKEAINKYYDDNVFENF